MKNQRVWVIFVLFLSGLLGFSVSLYFHSREVNEIQTFHYPTSIVKQLEGDKQAGMKIFKEFCASCHSKNPVIDVNAPRIGDKKAWDARSKLGMDTLLKITITGVGAMPARGGCFECSDEQLRETIQYVIENK